MKKLLLLFSMMALAFNAFADNYLTVDDIRVRPGAKANIVIKYHFDSQLICAYQFDMLLGNGITPALEKADLDQFTNDVPSTFIVGVNEVGDNHYRFATFSFGGNVGNEPITNAEGTLLTIQFTADADLQSGTEIDAQLFDVICPENNGTQYNLPNASFKIIIDENAGYTDLYETSEVAPEDANNVDARVHRTIKANEWSTICLPFDMTEEQVKASFGNDVQLADFTGWSVVKNDDGDISSINVSFSSISAIEANHPCIIKTSSDIDQFIVEGVNITVDDAEVSVRSGSTGKMRGYMFGTYEANTIVEDGDLFLAGNQFWYSTGKTKIKAFRGYFELAEYVVSYENFAKISFTIDDTPTSIMNVDTQESNNEIYSVSGMKVGKDASRLQRGVYIVNGKKVVKK